MPNSNAGKIFITKNLGNDENETLLYTFGYIKYIFIYQICDYDLLQWPWPVNNPFNITYPVQ